MATIHLRQELGYPLVMTAAGYQFTSPGFPAGSLLQGGTRTTTFNVSGFVLYDKVTAEYISDGTNVTFNNISFLKSGVVVFEFQGISATLAQVSLASWNLNFLNSGDDLIYGYTNDDVLHGGPGNDFFVGWAGDDTIIGGIGSDTAAFTGASAEYVFARNADGSVQVTGKDGFSGSDRILEVEFFQFDNGSFSFDALLPPPPPPSPPQDPYAGPNSIRGDSGNNTLKGFGGDDRLYGYTGNDKLYGGDGNDYLSGGKGKDQFVFDAQPNAKINVDKISDFRVIDDTITLENAVFLKVGSNGSLKAAAFWSNNTGRAHDKSDRIIYEKDTGKLFYDADGSGKIAGVQFATVAKNLALTQKDFFVI